ncbi:MAG: 23S rRNA (uracil(1939)-C(5))-methyltransferase RlmD [Alistipes sp.]|nr:23S rRNA (uracil(1939)-C(5))-methyltransferase RlmD [Alistipes sp.]
MLEKNKVYDAEITGLTSEGSGVCRVNDMAVFVPGTAVGDIIRVKIVKVLSRYAFGIVDEILKPSSDRCADRESGCGIHKKCGGCVFRHISYEAECRAKNDIVKDAFIRIGGLAPEFGEFMGAETPDRYRNKVQLPAAEIDGKKVFGFYAPRSHRVVPVDGCMLQPGLFDDIIKFISHHAQMNAVSVYDEKTGRGLLRHVYIRQGHHTGEVMVCFVVSSKDSANMPSLRNIMRSLSDRFKEIKSIVVNVNSKNTNVILGDECLTFFGSDTITDIMCGNEIEISPLSFYQINTPQAERMYRKALEYADPEPDDVLADLYCGAGTIGLSMAHRVKRLVGIEVVPDAVENARKNAERNGIFNADFYCGDAGEVFGILNISPDIIVVDPPRKGCSEETLNNIISSSPRKIIMISCNPSTAARDALFLYKNGFSVDKVCGADFFPGTRHVECVVLMSREK